MGKHGHSKASKASTASSEISHKSKSKSKHKHKTTLSKPSPSEVSTPRIATTPASTESIDPELEDNLLHPTPTSSLMEPEQTTSGAVAGSEMTTVDSAPTLEEDEGFPGSEPEPEPTVKTKKSKSKAKSRAKSSSKKKKEESSSESTYKSSDSDSDRDDESSSNDSSSSSSEDEKETRRKKKAAAKKKAKVTAKRKERESEKAKEKKKTKKKKSKKYDSSSDDSSDASEEADSESSEDETEKNKVGKKKVKLGAKGKTTKGKKQESSGNDSSSSLSSSAFSDSVSESEGEKKKQKKKAKAKAKAREKKSKHQDSSSDDFSSSSSSSSSSSGSETEAEDKKKKSRKSKKSKKIKGKKSHKGKKIVVESSSSSESEVEETIEVPATTTDDKDAELIAIKQNELAVLQLQLQQKQAVILATGTKIEEIKTEKKTKKGAVEFKRVDQVWDSTVHDYKYTETGKENKDEFDCVFSVRRKFTWDNKFQYTTLDIKSNLLRDALQVILKGVRGVSLVEDKPNVHPHMIFLYYDELEAYIKKLKTQLKKAKKRKEQRKLKQQVTHCKLLASFIDEDYEETRKKLKSMLKSGNITYDLSWALFKPDTIAYTPTYGNKDDPRAFRVDMTYHEEDFLGNEKLVIEGRYLEYDGKVFGMGDYAVRIPAFKGPKKIVNLDAYPLKYHKDPEGLEKQLVERGQKFVALQGMNYRVHKGIGYMKQKRSVARVNVDGRVMVDPAIFRRIQPNYHLSYIKQDEVGVDSDSDSCSGCDNDSDADSEGERSGSSTPKRLIVWKDKKGKKHLIPVPADSNPDSPGEKLESIEKDDGIQHTFTEEELLIASPVVLGFAFSEKCWLELSLSGIREIEWNQEAFSSLVLQPKYKQNLKGLVRSHRFNAAKTIDDVIQGKGKGMVVVLHGPPGVGKTLTAESIAEYLRCPLYMVSAGELGTNSRTLENDLNRIMDITHSWGAILLIDEADVFMEARQAHDIHRNSLVSVFLRLLEYYQGILFLTTNRVATFDEAFQSRIHMGIRYEELTQKARLEIWKHHIGKVVNMEGPESVPFKDEDIEELARKVLNGRQIKNTVKTAQSIALSENEAFGISHVKRVLEVQEDFQEDMRGGRSTLAHYA